MDSTPSKESLRERAARAHLDKLWRRGVEFLGCRYAILGGAMTWVSDRHLVSAISNGGGFGIIASGSMSPNLLSAEIAATAAMTTRPFGVNLITLHPQLSQLIDVCLEQKVSHIVLAGGLPPGGAIQRVKNGGAKLVCFAPALVLANAATKRFQEAQRTVIEKFNRGEYDQKSAMLEIEHFWAGALRRAVIEGDVENGSLMAGQSVGMVSSEQPTATILGDLVGQAI